MGKRILLGGLLGGLTVFIWQMISHMFIPWFHNSLNGFDNPKEVEAAIVKNVKGSGMYISPWLPHGAPEDKMTEAQKQMTEGFSIFASVHPNGKHGMAEALPLQFGCNVIGAVLCTFILCQFKHAGMGCRVGVVLFFALFAVTTSVIPNWAWWGHSPSFTGFLIFDHVVGWGLAGFVLAKLTLPKPEESAGEALEEAEAN